MSNYVVSARKYRPMRFDEVVGQNHVSNTLKNALKTNHLGHSFLFCGPRGVGKTTSARILAKVLNCENRTEDFEPCNSCTSCSAFNQNQSFNIYELDAASNNSVDNIRELVEQVRFAPQQGDYKVYIIDEVHMLSQAAFNAFLKTLEEPPHYAIFILATTEKHKILPTILSRCQIFDFNRVQVKDIVSHLQSICDQESIVAEEAGLHIIAQKADGALRDALSIFDRIISLSGDQLTANDVNEGLNLLDTDTYFELTNHLLLQNRNKTLLLFDQILKNGFDGDQVMLGLAEHLRNLLVVKNPATHQLLEVSSDMIEKYQNQSTISSSSFLLNALNITNDCDIQFKQAKNKRLHVELALLKICYLSQLEKDIALASDQIPTLKKKNESNLEETDTLEKEPTLHKNVQQTNDVFEKDTKVEIEQTPTITPSAEVVDEQIQVVEEAKVEQLTAQNIETVTEEHITTEEEQQLSSSQTINKSVTKKSLSNKIQPALSFRLSQLNAEVEKRKKRKEREEETETNSLTVNKENPIVSEEQVKNAWYSIADKVQSGSLKKGITDSKVDFKDEHIQVTVYGKVIKDYLKEHHNLIVSTVQDQTGLQRFTYEIECVEIDKTDVKTYTKEEELAYLQQKNPSIKKLCDSLNLEIRYDN